MFHLSVQQSPIWLAEPCVIARGHCQDTRDPHDRRYFSTKKSGRKKASAKPVVSVWLGVTLHSLTGAECAAFGNRKKDGGPDRSARGINSVKTGLAENDLSQGVNGNEIDVFENFPGYRTDVF